MRAQATVIGGTGRKIVQWSLIIDRMEMTYLSANIDRSARRLTYRITIIDRVGAHMISRSITIDRLRRRLTYLATIIDRVSRSIFCPRPMLKRRNNGITIAPITQYDLMEEGRCLVNLRIDSSRDRYRNPIFNLGNRYITVFAARSCARNACDGTIAFASR